MVKTDQGLPAEPRKDTDSLDSCSFYEAVKKIPNGKKNVIKDKSSVVSSTSDSAAEEDTREAIKKNLSKAETKRVTFIRFTVLAVLVISAVAISIVVFKVTSNAEAEAFETQFNGAANKVLGKFGTPNVGPILALGQALTSEGLGDHRTNFFKPTKWPFVTLPDFHYRTSLARTLSGVGCITVRPIVTEDKRIEWEKYSVGPAKEWIGQTLDFQREQGMGNFEVNTPPLDQVLMTNYTSQPISVWNATLNAYSAYPGPGPYYPRWQTNPVLLKDRVNEHPGSLHTEQIDLTVQLRQFTGGFREYGRAGTILDENATIARWASLLSISQGHEERYNGSVMLTRILPVFNTFENSSEIVAVVEYVQDSLNVMKNNLPENIRGIHVVAENTCDGFFTYVIDGASARVVGRGDLHERAFEKYKQSTPRPPLPNRTASATKAVPVCYYQIHVYPTKMFSDDVLTNTPMIVTAAVATVLLFSICLFVFYSYLVEQRQQMVLNKAAQSTAIVSSMFPKQVRDRLLEDDGNRRVGSKFGSRNQLQSFLNGDIKGETGKGNIKQIADLYTECTVLFADLAGFTAWSSTRGPEHVFMLLQTIYHGFDQIAKRRKVFKVETIGDCYLAATGLPDPQPAHALIMARFAWECRQKLHEMTRELEVTLGPDCSELRMRYGMNSGPVTAGVLLGDRARFQLFGDTVNTASRMESTSIRDKIQISQSTAEQLFAVGKGHWLTARTDSVEAKGKGILQTYWLDAGKSRATSSENGDTRSHTDSSSGHVKSNEKVSLARHDRLVEWMVDLLLENIRLVKAKEATNENSSTVAPITYSPSPGGTFLDEVVEVIPMSKYDSSVPIESKSVDVPQEIVMNLREYVAMIARMYCDNPFHCFEHACHVTMSVSKLLKRIVAPDVNLESLDGSDADDAEKLLSMHLHHCTYGIQSDPLAQLAIIFSALIHDVDHRGCSNAQLIKENEALGSRYHNKSVAEQNSLELAWTLLLTDQFQALRRYIFGRSTDLLRFRQLIVNTVLATDIFDKELNALRKTRWERAFSGDYDNDEHQLDRKATIVIEHIIQASDVSHTMQHWQIYTKWNKLLFKEMYLAYKAGRMGADPLTFWYKGELGFYDNYVIPLAKKLKECNVFGVSSDEYLNYAMNNRKEWESRGEAIVEELAKEVALLNEGDQL